MDKCGAGWEYNQNQEGQVRRQVYERDNDKEMEEEEEGTQDSGNEENSNGQGEDNNEQRIQTQMEGEKLAQVQKVESALASALEKM